MKEAPTDRRILQTEAYPDASNLEARANIYRYRRPPLDFAGWALARLGGIEQGPILDLGCGPGRYLRRLAVRGVRVVGADLSGGMLREVVTRWDASLRRPLLVAADGEALPFADGTFEAALAMHMLYHVPDLERAVAELRRVIRPGGRLLAVTNGRDHLAELQALLDTTARSLGGEHFPTGSDRRFDLTGGRALLERHFAHVEVEEVRGVLVVPQAEPLEAYVESTRPIREPQLAAGVGWEPLVATFRRTLRRRIEEEGVFEVATHSGVFACR